jgi:predicted acylesterase/phospholipase RssA
MTSSVAVPEETCDLTLKGGITSGVVYPLVASRLAEKYRLVNIGGSSAGAIAAAAIAAAEYGRQHGVDGFAVLRDLPRRLGDTPSGATGNTLFALFEPQRACRPLFRVLRAAQSASKSAINRVLRATWTAFRCEIASAAGWWRVAVPALPGLVVLLVAVLAARPVWAAALAGAIGLLLTVAGTVAGTGWALVHRLLTELPRNYLGVVNGSGSPAALTPWLSALVDEAAGHAASSPLTIADLWGASTDAEKRACLLDRDRRRINLEVTTTNLCEGRPQRLPLLSDEYFFAEREFRDLFPDAVVDAMLSAPDIGDRTYHEQRERDLITRLAGLDGYARMPVADLPVVVAARLSLSFPLLLSAVPIYKIDFSHRNNQDAIAAARQWLAAHPDLDLTGSAVGDALTDGTLSAVHMSGCWLSDGGMTSNMPLHFFDAPLPRRPSFAVNLRSRRSARQATAAATADGAPAPATGSEVLLAQDNWQGRLGTWTSLGNGHPTVPKFVGAMATTMQNWVDNAQMRMPGYRDRIVTIYLSPDEGGMNLDMDADRIAALSTRGGQAADLLVERYATPPADGWRNHRWVRYRSVMAMLERMLEHMDRSWDADPGMSVSSYHQMADDAGRPTDSEYPLPTEDQPWVHHRSAELVDLAGRWPQAIDDAHGNKALGSFVHQEPLPRPVWRGQPEL